MKQENIQLIFLVMIFILIVIMSFLCFYLVKNVNLLKSEPIKFGITKYGFDSCSCMLTGKFVNFNKSGDLEVDGTKRNIDFIREG